MFDLRNLPPAFYDDPYPTYRALQAETPVYRMPDGGWFLTRHADLDMVYRDTARFKSDKREEFRPKFGASPLYEHHTTSLVFNDPPLHSRVRRLLAGALTPRALAAMEPSLLALVRRLLDALPCAADLIEDFAAAIPVEVIGNLLAVPHADRGPLRNWSLAILGALEPATPPDMLARGNAAVTAFTAYLRTLVADRRAHPGDPAHDVLTRLIGNGSDGEQLSEAELLHNCIFILNAGHETTTNLIGNGLYLLLQWPDQRRRLLADPGLIPTAVEEFLRFESSNQLGNRTAAVDVEIGGQAIAAGSSLTLCIGAANRDPGAFADPDKLDVGRQPNRHVAFAAGAHQCIGMSLARLEGRIAIGQFLARFPDYALRSPPARAHRARFRGLMQFPVNCYDPTKTRPSQI